MNGAGGEGLLAATGERPGMLTFYSAEDSPHCREFSGPKCPQQSGVRTRTGQQPRASKGGDNRKHTGGRRHLPLSRVMCPLRPEDDGAFRQKVGSGAAGVG